MCRQVVTMDHALLEATATHRDYLSQKSVNQVLFRTRLARIRVTIVLLELIRTSRVQRAVNNVLRVFILKKRVKLVVLLVSLGSIITILVVLLVISVLLAFIVRVEGLLIRLNALQAITVLLEQKEVPSIPAIMVLSATRLCLWLLLTANLAFLVCIVINVALYIRSINVQLVFTVEAGLLQGIRAIVENLVWTPPMPA